MYKLYKIKITKSDGYYIGMTKNSLFRRFNNHVWKAKTGVKSKLYDYIRKYGVDCFYIELLAEYDNKQDCCDAEIEHIRLAKNLNENVLNLAKGGEGGFCVPDIESWKSKLSKVRVGRKPFLGNKHTENTKVLCSVASKDYWKDKQTYDKESVLKYSFKEANNIYGISRTHYYRLKRSKNNEHRQ